MSLFLITFFTGVGLFIAAIIHAVTVKDIPLDSDCPLNPTEHSELQHRREAADKCALRLRITATAVIIISIIGVFPAVNAYEEHLNAIREEEYRRALDELAEEMFSSTTTPQMQEYFKLKQKSLQGRINE